VSAWLNLTLDTTAPAVTWGAVTDPNAGEIMSVEYLVDEPGIVSAEIELQDGRIIPMDVGPSLLTVELPNDTPQGNGIVRAHVQDDALNTATRTLTVALTGVIAPITEPVRTSAPFQVTPELKSSRTRSRTSSSARVAFTLSSSRSTAFTSSSYVGPSQRERVVRTRLFHRTTERWTYANQVVTARAATSSQSAVVRKRGEGPSGEDDLILLLL
jgi:hypothetical protein